MSGEVAAIAATAPWSVSAKELYRKYSGKSVVVIGAGIIGSSISYHLKLLGANVTVLESKGVATGTTHDSFAWLNSFSKNPREYYELNLLGILAWHRIQSLIGNSLKIQWGGTVSWKRKSDALENVVSAIKRQQSWGYPTSLVDYADLNVLLPSLAVPPEDDVGLVLFSQVEGIVNPPKAAEAILNAAIKSGVKFECPVSVTGFDVHNGSIIRVQTNQGSITSDDVVIAAGIGSTRLAQLLNANVPLKPSQGILAHTEPMDRFLERMAAPPGANIKQDPEGDVVTGASFGDSNLLPTTENGKMLLNFASKYFPVLKSAKLSNVTLGHRVLPADGYPIVGYLPGVKNAYVAAMHSGMTLGPLIGQLAAQEIVLGIRADVLNPYTPARFS